MGNAPASRAAAGSTLSNSSVAARLDAAADLLEQQGANPFRVGAYRRAASRIRTLDRSVVDLVRHEGREALVALPDIGHGIAGAIDEMARAGRWSLLDRLQGGTDAEGLLQTVPGIGPALAEKIHDGLQIDSLESLEMAAYDGRLERIPGVGPARASAIRAYLSFRLGSGRPPARRRLDAGPGVAVLLEVDREYRERAAAGRLQTIAPRRFNPKGLKWLPIGHFEHAGWHFTALFSNTARAHRLGRTKDWVVIYFYDDDHREGQYTVVTETRGHLAGLRVVRGREEDCTEHYEAADDAWSHNREIDLDLARRSPGAVFSSPRELAAHPDLTIEQKIDLLRRWQYDATQIMVAEEEGMVKAEEPTLLERVLRALEDLTGGFEVERSAPTKQGGESP